MEISVEPMNYGQRLARAVIWPIFLGSMMIGVFAIRGIVNSLQIIIAITITLGSFLRHLHWYKYYITRINFEATRVKIEVYNYDKLHSYVIPNDQIKIIKDKAFGRGSVCKLNFFQNNKLLFNQYQVIGWRNREKILSIYSQFKELDSSDRQGNEMG